MRILWGALALSLAGAAALVGFWIFALNWRPLGDRPEIALVMVAGAAAGLLHRRPNLRSQQPMVAAAVAFFAWLALRTLLPHGANWGMILSYATVAGFFAVTPPQAPAAVRLWAGRIAFAFGVLLTVLSVWHLA